MGKIRKLNSGVETIEKMKEEPRNKETRVYELDPGNAKTIMFSWSFTDFRQVPWELPEKNNGIKKAGNDYTTKRISEVMQSGGGIEPETVEKQRPGVMDTGKHLLEAKHCEGGLNLYNQLLENGWKITDAWFSRRESEQSKAEQKGHTKFRVQLFLSYEGKEAKLEDVTLRGLKRLLGATWIVHIWDNRRVNNGITVNFTFCQKATPFETKIAL